jgi:AcrR family transcriptional regulator
LSESSVAAPALVSPITRPVPPRGRPAPLPYELRGLSAQRRADLREAGARVLAVTGGDGAMGEIARLVGLRPASITNFYPRKHDLTYDILHAHIDGLMEHVGGTEDAAVNADPFMCLTCMVQAYLDFVLAYRDEQRVALTLLDNLPTAQRDPLRYQLRLLAHRLAVAIEAAAPELGDAAALRRPVSLNLMAMLNAAVLWFRDDGALSREDFAQLLAYQAVAGARAMLGR